MQLPIKIILNSFYGKTGERIRRRIIGNLFNSVIFAAITGATRAQMYMFVSENKIGRDMVGIATDSICSTKRLDLASGKLGDFGFVESAEDVYYLQNGFYRFNGKWKQRGLGRLNGKQIEALEPFKRDGKLFYEYVVKRNNKIISSIVQNRISDIGKIVPTTRKVNLNADRKRFWFGRLESIDSKIHNESISLSLNHFRKEKI